jgi:hypothetical protein
MDQFTKDENGKACLYPKSMSDKSLSRRIASLMSCKSGTTYYISPKVMPKLAHAGGEYPTDLIFSTDRRPLAVYCDANGALTDVTGSSGIDDYDAVLDGMMRWWWAEDSNNNPNSGGPIVPQSPELFDQWCKSTHYSASAADSDVVYRWMKLRMEKNDSAVRSELTEDREERSRKESLCLQGEARIPSRSSAQDREYSVCILAWEEKEAILRSLQ